MLTSGWVPAQHLTGYIGRLGKGHDRDFPARPRTRAQHSNGPNREGRKSATTAQASSGRRRRWPAVGRPLPAGRNGVHTLIAHLQRSVTVAFLSDGSLSGSCLRRDPLIRRGIGQHRVNVRLDVLPYVLDGTGVRQSRGNGPARGLPNRGTPALVRCWNSLPADSMRSSSCWRRRCDRAGSISSRYVRTGISPPSPTCSARRMSSAVSSRPPAW